MRLRPLWIGRHCGPCRASGAVTVRPAAVIGRKFCFGIWRNVSDPALEAAIVDRLSFRRFVGLSLHDRTADRTTLCRFRQELASDGLIEKIFAEINRQSEDKKLILKQGTLVDASLIPGSGHTARQGSQGCAARTAQTICGS